VDEIERLAEADAFRSLGLDRREAVWAVRALNGRSAAETLPLFDQPGLRLADTEPATKLPAMTRGEHVVHDYRSLGLSLKAHPVGFLRPRLDRLGVVPNALLSTVPDGRRVCVAGLVLVRQRPGKGNAIFLTLEDEKAVANIIIWPRIFDRYRAVIMGARFVRVTGKLQSESDVIHIVADRIEDLTPWLAVLLEETGVASTEDREADRGKGRDPDKRRAGGPVPGKDPAAALANKARSVMPKGRNFQ
jgi:error-prone DNA polymerase